MSLPPFEWKYIPAITPRGQIRVPWGVPGGENPTLVSGAGSARCYLGPISDATPSITMITGSALTQCQAQSSNWVVIKAKSDHLFLGLKLSSSFLRHPIGPASPSLPSSCPDSSWFLNRLELLPAPVLSHLLFSLLGRPFLPGSRALPPSCHQGVLWRATSSESPSWPLFQSFHFSPNFLVALLSWMNLIPLLFFFFSISLHSDEVYQGKMFLCHPQLYPYHLEHHLTSHWCAIPICFMEQKRNIVTNGTHAQNPWLYHTLVLWSWQLKPQWASISPSVKWT